MKSGPQKHLDTLDDLAQDMIFDNRFEVKAVLEDIIREKIAKAGGACPFQ